MTELDFFLFYKAPPGGWTKGGTGSMDRDGLGWDGMVELGPGIEEGSRAWTEADCLPVLLRLPFLTSK